jgi:hypothetical protein
VQALDPTAGAAASSGPPVVHPAEPYPGRAGGSAVGRRIVAHVEGAPRRDPERVEGHLKDAGIGLCVAAALGGHDDLEERVETSNGEPRALHAVDAVRHDAEPIVLPKLLQDGPATGQPVTPLRQMVEVRLAEPPGEPGGGPGSTEEPAEPLASELGLGDLTPAIRGPQFLVDPAVGGEGRGSVQQPQREKRPLQGDALGPFVVEKGVVDVEEDGAETVQEPTWRGR